MKPTKQRLDPLHRHFLLPPPVPLYHYTSLEVLEKITAKGEVWATDVNFLNDKTEYVNARKFIEDPRSRARVMTCTAVSALELLIRNVGSVSI